MLLSDKEKLYAAIGRIVVEAGRTEELLAILACALANQSQPDLGRAFTTDCPLNRLIDAVLWLYSETGGTNPQKLRTTLDNVSSNSNSRNEIVHAYVSVSGVFERLFPNESPPPPQIDLIKFKHQNRKGPEVIDREYSLQELNDIADKMSTVSKQLREFIAEVRAPAT